MPPFADDCLVYREIRSPEDQVSLQKDLDALEQWSIQWGMLFNAKKCNIMTVSRSTTPLLKFYQIDNTILDNVDSCTYLGILLTSDMSWSSHISSCAKKANARLGFLRRNPDRLPPTAQTNGLRVISPFVDGIQLSTLGPPPGQRQDYPWGYTKKGSEMDKARLFIPI